MLHHNSLLSQLFYQYTSESQSSGCYCNSTVDQKNNVDSCTLNSILPSRILKYFAVLKLRVHVYVLIKQQSNLSITVCFCFVAEFKIWL